MSDTPTTYRCSGCGHKWKERLPSAELCGDCWHTVQTAPRASGSATPLNAMMTHDVVCGKCGAPIRDGFCDLSCDGRADGIPVTWELAPSQNAGATKAMSLRNHLPAWLREQADNTERTDPHGHMDVSMALTYAADALREAAAALESATPQNAGATKPEGSQEVGAHNSSSLMRSSSSLRTLVEQIENQISAMSQASKLHPLDWLILRRHVAALLSPVAVEDTHEDTDTRTGDDGLSTSSRTASTNEKARDMTEQCICAAIRLPNGEVWRGHRHDSAIMTAGRANVSKEAIYAAEQGFITSRNRFVSREEGARLQRAAGIPSADTAQPVGDMLFSEDLYLREWRESATLPNAGATPTDTPVEVGAQNLLSSSLLSPVEGEYRSGSNQVGETTICPACVVQDPRLRLCDVHRSPVEGRTNDDDLSR
jgi:hypothetical protein